MKNKNIITNPFGTNLFGTNPFGRLVALLTMVSLILSVTGCSGSAPEIGEYISLGGYEWLVLDVEGKKALVLSKDILTIRAYDSAESNTTWEESDMREFLNGSFYENSFLDKEKAKIAETRNVNSPNPWYNTPGGIDTVDKIFLLSVDEVVKYFGDSGALADRLEEAALIYDEFDEARVAFDRGTEESRFWWLRTPGRGRRTMYVGDSGFIAVIGTHINTDRGGVRPALWVYF